MNGADELRAEHIGKIGRNGSEAAAIHRQDDADGADEYRLRAGIRGPRHQQVTDDPENKERVVGVLAPDIIGERGPEEPAADIEQREQSGETGGDPRDEDFLVAAQSIKAELWMSDQFAAEDFLQH